MSISCLYVFFLDVLEGFLLSKRDKDLYQYLEEYRLNNIFDEVLHIKK